MFLQMKMALSLQHAILSPIEKTSVESKTLNGGFILSRMVILEYEDAKLYNVFSTYYNLINQR